MNGKRILQLCFTFKKSYIRYYKNMHVQKFKYQLIDDFCQLRPEKFEQISEMCRSVGRKYHVISIIGSQSSGKSTLLNELFQTNFKTQQRAFQQTTKGIWISFEPQSRIFVFDVEGSDSNERENQSLESRIKIQRTNSLFALAVSNYFLVNMFIQQLGLYSGSQLEILQIILKLNLKLFGYQKPKKIYFVIRDTDLVRQNLQENKSKLFKQVEKVWNDIPEDEKINKEGKPISLKEVFELNAIFLPFYEEEQFKIQCAKFAKILKELPEETVEKNIPASDLPNLLSQAWEQIRSDEDINLPNQKIVLANMRCHDIKKMAQQKFGEEFRDKLQKSQRQLDNDFAANVKKIVNKMIEFYREKTVQYTPDQVKEVQKQFLEQLQRKIERAHSSQITQITDQNLRQFKENVRKMYFQDQNIEHPKKLKNHVIQLFQKCMTKICYNEKWIEREVNKFKEEIQKCFIMIKKIICEERIAKTQQLVRQQIEGIVSKAFYDKNTFCGNFWGFMRQKAKAKRYEIQKFISDLKIKLQLREGEENDNLQQRQNRLKEIKSGLQSSIRLKIKDLDTFLMKHFNTQFNYDEKDFPIEWQSMTQAQIDQRFNRIKQKYKKLLHQEFDCFHLEEHPSQRMSESHGALKYKSTIQFDSFKEDELLSSSQMLEMSKKIDQKMKNQLQQAKKKNKETFVGSIPVWAWVLLLFVAFDDCLGMLTSPYLMIPLTIIILAVIVLFALGGKQKAMFVLNSVFGMVKSSISGAGRAAASSLKKSN